MTILAVSQETVMENFKRYDLLDDNVIFIRIFRNQFKKCPY